MNLRESLTFGFETTFTIPDWWTEPGFCSDWETPMKLDLMKKVATEISKHLGGKVTQNQDSYGAQQWETWDRLGNPSFVVTSEPGSIEIKTPPAILEELTTTLGPLFESANLVGLCTSRSWWYGVKSGTGGGCHLNMAGHTSSTNPWAKNPKLLIQYFAFYHNRPELHFPFMGPDIGFGGNCMRIDETGPDSEKSFDRFAEVSEKLHNGWIPSIKELGLYFEGTPLKDVKHCSPTFRKIVFENPIVEDRAVESLENPYDCYLLSLLRIKILESLEKQTEIETLKHFEKSLHEDFLFSPILWQKLSSLVLSFDLEAAPFRKFIERQFPALNTGLGVPRLIQLREGRRPRRILGVADARGSLILNKKIDTRYRRYELQWPLQGQFSLFLNGKKLSSRYQNQELGIQSTYVDLFVENPNGSLLSLKLEGLGIDGKTQILEEGLFDLGSLLWKDHHQGESVSNCLTQSTFFESHGHSESGSCQTIPEKY